MEQIGLAAVFDLGKFDSGAAKYSKAVDDLNKKTDSVAANFGKGFDKIGDSVLKVAGIMSGAIVAGAAAGTAAIGAFAVGGVQKAMDLESQLSSIAATLNMTKEQVAPLNDLILQLGLDPNLKVSATEAATAIENLAKNGLSMQQIIDGAARSTVLLANATGADFGMAADIATDTMALFNIKAEEMSRAVDQITGVTNASKFTINDYKLALAQGGGVAAATGVEFEDFNATIAAISPLFASGSDAGTSFKTMLLNMIPKSGDAATAMDELGLMTFKTEEALRVLQANGVTPASEGMLDMVTALQQVFEKQTGLSVATEEGQKGWTKWFNSMELMNSAFFDANGQMKSMADITEIMHEALAGLSEEQKNEALNTIFGTDAMRAAVGVANAGAVAYKTAAEASKALGVSMEDAAKVAEGGITVYEAMQLQIAKIDASEQAATRMNNFKGALEILQGAIETLQIQIGQAFLPVLTQLAQKATELVSAWGPKIFEAFQAFAGVIEDVMKAISEATTPVEAFTGVLSALGLSSGQISLALGAIGLAAAVAKATWDSLVTVFEAVRTALDPLWQQFTSIAQALGEDFTGSLTSVTPLVEGLGGAFAGIAAVLAGSAIASAIIGIGGAILGLLNPVSLILVAAAALGYAWSTNWMGIRDITAQAVAKAQEVITGLQETVANIGTTIKPHMDLITGALAGIGTVLTGMGISAAVGALGTAFASLTTSAGAVGTAILALNPWLLALGLVVGTLTAAWQGNWFGMRDTATAAMAAVQTAISPLTTAIQEFGSGALTEIQSFVTGNQTEFTNLQAIWTGAQASADNVFSLIAGAVGTWLPVLQSNFAQWGAAAGAWITDAAATIAAEVGTWYTNLSGELATRLETFKTEFANWKLAAVDWLKEAGTNVATRLGEWYTDLSGELTTKLATWKTAFDEWKAGAADWLKEAGTNAATTLGEWYTSLSGELTTKLAAWKTAFDDWKTAAADWLKETDVVAQVGEWYTDLTVELAAKLDTFKTEMLDWALELTDWVLDPKASPVANLGKWLADLIAWIPTGVDLLAAEMLKFATSLVTWIGDSSTDALPELGKWLGKILAWIPLGVLALGREAVKFAGALIGWIAGGGGEESGGDENAAGKADAEMEKFKTALLGALVKVKDAFLEGVQAFVDEWTKTMNEHVDWPQVGSDIINAIWSGVESMKALLTGTFQSIVSNVVGFFTNTDWGSLGQSAINQVKAGVNGVANSLLTTVGGIVSDAAAKFTSFDWAGLGSDVIDGILKGLQSNGSAIVDYIYGLGEQALDKVKAFLGISSPSRVFMQIGYWIIRGWMIGMQKQGSALMAAVDRLGGSMAKIAARAGAQTSEAFVDALGSFRDLGEARIEEVRAMFEEAALLSGKIAGMGLGGSMAHRIYGDRATELDHLIYAFEAESKLLEQQQNTLAMIRAIENAGGDVTSLMSGFLIGDQFEIDAERQVKLTTEVMKTLNNRLHQSLLRSVRGFTDQAKQVQAIAEKSLAGFGETARDRFEGLLETIFNPDRSMADSQRALGDLQMFGATLANIKRSLEIMASQRLSAQAIIEDMTGEFDMLDDFKRRIADYDEQIEALQARILETGDQSLLGGLRVLDTYRGVVTADLRSFLMQSERAEQALEGFGDKARAEVKRILDAMYGDDVSFEERLGILPHFEKMLNDLWIVRAQLNTQKRLSAQAIIDEARGQFDQLENFQQRIEGFDEQIAELQDHIMETGDRGLIPNLLGLDRDRSRAEADLRAFLLQTSKLDDLFRRIRSVAGAGELSASRFLAEQIQPIRDAFSQPMREIDRANWIKAAEQRINALNRFADQMRAVERLQNSIAGSEGFDSLADEFLALQDIAVPETDRLALMRTVEVYINQIKAFRVAQKDFGDVLSNGFGKRFQAETIDPLLAKIEDLNTSEQERARLMAEYQVQQDKLLAVGKQQQYLEFLEEQTAFLDSIKGLGADTNQIARLSEIFQGLQLGPNASVQALMDAETRLMHERIRLTEEYLKRQQKVLELEEKQAKADYLNKQVDLITKLTDLEDEYGTGTVPLGSILRGVTWGANMTMDDFLKVSGQMLDVMIRIANKEIGSRPGVALNSASNMIPYTTNNQSLAVNMGGVIINNGMDDAMFEARVRQIIRNEF